MSKLVKIDDRKPMEIYIGRKTRGPISDIRLSDAVIGRILRSIDPPKDIYAIGPNDMLVKLTLDNYEKSEEELFAPKKEIVVPPPVIDESKAKAEALRKTLEAKKNIETETVKTVEDKNDEPVDSKVEDTIDSTIEANNNTVAKVTPVKEEEKKDTVVKQVVNNNYSKNYKNHNKNKK